MRLARSKFLAALAGLVFVEEAKAVNISISIPGDGSALKGTIPVSVEVKPLKNLDRVALYVEDTLLGSDTADPFDFSWDTTLVPDGAHVLRAKAFYKQRVSEASLAVNVANGAAPPPSGGTVYDVPLSGDVQARLASIPSGTQSNPSIVRLQAGTLDVPSQLAVQGKSWWIVESPSATLGGSTTLRWTTPVTLSGGVYSGNDSLRLLRFTECKNIVLRYLTLVGASPMPTSGDGFKPWEANVQHMHSLTISRCENFTVDRVKIDGSGGGDAINWGNENQGLRSTGLITGCDIRNAHRCGVAVVGSGGLTIRGNVFARIGFWTIDLEPNTLGSSNYATLIEENTFESQVGLVSRAAIGAFAGSKDGAGECDGLTIRSNHFLNRTAEIRLNTNINGGYPYPKRIKNVRIEGNSVNVSGPQIEIRQVDTLDVSGNDFAAIPDPELGLWSCTDFRISGSTYKINE